jgi:hypothetical protein
MNGHAKMRQTHTQRRARQLHNAPASSPPKQYWLASGRASYFSAAPQPATREEDDVRNLRYEWQRMARLDSVA